MSDTQWQELEGEPNTVEAKGRRYTELAEAIARSVSSLQQIVDDTNTTAKSMDKTRKLAGEVREDIEKARERYSYTGEALTAYGASLRAAKNEADPAAARLRTLRADLETAQATASSAESGVDDLPKDASDADKSDAQRAQTNANNAVNDLQSQITQAEAEWNSGHGDKNSAASTAISQIEEVVSGDKVNGLEDGFWDGVGEVWESVGKWVKMACDIAGILAIFLSWVPILGQILLVMAAIGSIIAIIEGIVKMANEGFSWGALFGIGMGVMGLFGGKALGALGKYAKARAITQTRNVRGITEARKIATVSELVEASGTKLSTRALDTLKSPFVRNATDGEIWRMAQRGTYGEAFSTWRGAKFPIPYKDGGMRFALGNDDVMDMTKFFSQTGVQLDGLTSAAQAIAITGSVTHNAAKMGQIAAGLGTGISGGDGWGVASSGSSAVTSGAGGSYGTLMGNSINIGKGLFG
ncbi:hypothetical protein GCM10027063_45500 [Promicromonospora xylanilytica]